MDNTTPTLSPPADETAVTGYTLYPDAGDFTGLDTPATPPGQPLPTPDRSHPPSPRPSPIIFPQDIPTPPPTAGERTKPHPRRLSVPRFFIRLAYVLCALLAAAVYADLLLSGGSSLLAQGIGKLAVQAVFGSTDTVTALPDQSGILSRPTETDPLPAETTAPEHLPLSAETEAPPANEQPAPLPVTGILSRDLSSKAVNGLGLINETPYTPDLTALAARPPVIDSYAALESIYGKNCPAVLILHTHGTEAFQDQADAGYHTEDPTKNILTVGRALSDVLTASGIGTIHCTDLFDAESFDMAYYNAARYIRQTLEENPSIRYILDIHRDAITTEDGTGIRPLSTEAETEYAQMMFVVGTDHGGSGHTGWETNLTLAARLQSSIHKNHPTLMRDINLRSASFNAQYAPGSLLIEAGAACSVMEEAVRSIEILGQALVKEILGE